MRHRNHIVQRPFYRTKVMIYSITTVINATTGRPVESSRPYQIYLKSCLLVIVKRMNKTLVGVVQTLLVNLHHLAVVGHDTVHLAFDIGCLSIDSG